ncbi:MAG: hydrogenase expression/formation C-terminal domain-containing protein [Pseudomonadota bacterium]
MRSADNESKIYGNLDAVLAEVRHALGKFLDTGESTTIDLNALPFGAGDESALFEALGHGEVEMVLTAMGQSRLWESRYAGVWLVAHHNGQGERVALQIEITDVPSIARSQRGDMEEALRRLPDSPWSAVG